MIVGLTGGIGSGKTTVAKLFQKLGVPIYISDLEAKKLMVSSPKIKSALLDLFGKQAYIDSQLNKPFLASKIFNDNVLLKAMNAIVHPEVALHFNEWYKKQKSHFVIKEAAVLFENGSYLHCDYIITVTAPKDTRINRVIFRDKSSIKKVEAIINNQWSDQERLNLSHFEIKNIDLDQTKHQVKKVFDTLMRYTN